MKKPILAVDVDLTVVDTITHWLTWYKQITGHCIENDIFGQHYDIEKIMSMHLSPRDYWKLPDLYDKLEPIEGSVNALTKLSEKYDIIFVSACFPEHEMSKKYFIQRNFPFYKGFISTNKKGYVMCDVFIDDYSKYLKQVQDLNPECLCIMHKSPLNQNLESDFPVMSWDEILKKL
jgi:5'(3')-deoxyribonucleotidase